MRPLMTVLPRMPRVTLIAALSIALALVGCSKSGEQAEKTAEGGVTKGAPEAAVITAAEDRILTHLEAVVDLLDDNADSPDKANAALQKYAEANKDDIAKLGKELKELNKAMSEKEKKKRGQEMKRKMSRLMERMMKLMADHPELAKNDGINKTLQAIFPF